MSRTQTITSAANPLLREVRRAMADPDVREKLVAQSLTLSTSTTAQFAAHIRSEHAKWGKLIREAGIKGE